MSASLVGSEMCIRDRACNPRTHAPPQVDRRARKRPVKSASTYARRVALPVSYTHLTLPTICSV
eukprot:5521312-Alexandrium_andersonii.AAC.1